MPKEGSKASSKCHTPKCQDARLVLQTSGSYSGTKTSVHVFHCTAHAPNQTQQRLSVPGNKIGTADTAGETRQVLRYWLREP